jgi:hypothetical protein
MAVVRGESMPSPLTDPADQIAAVACQHLAAGADQVCLQTAGASGVPREQWDLLAEVLIT